MSLTTSYYDTIRDLKTIKYNIASDSLENKIFLTESAIGDIVGDKAAAPDVSHDIESYLGIADHIKNKFENNVTNACDTITRKFSSLPKLDCSEFKKPVTADHIDKIGHGSFDEFKPIFNREIPDEKITFKLVNLPNGKIAGIITKEKESIINGINDVKTKIATYHFSKDKPIDSINKFGNYTTDAYNKCMDAATRCDRLCKFVDQYNKLKNIVNNEKEEGELDV